MLRCHNLIFLSFLLLAVLSSCSTSRHSYAVTEVSDTTYVVVRDTLRVTQVRDSVVVHWHERTHEEDITIFDPQTGTPVSRQVTRDTERDMDSLAQHMADSIFQSYLSMLTDTHDARSEQQSEQHSGQSALSPLQLFARKVASLVCFLFVIGLVVVIARVLRHS